VNPLFLIQNSSLSFLEKLTKGIIELGFEEENASFQPSFATLWVTFFVFITSNYKTETMPDSTLTNCHFHFEM